MKTTTLICAGGSGARVMESVLHLCAAGLGPSTLRAFVIDSDGTNGNVDRTKHLVDRYQECQRAFGKSQKNFFQTELDLLYSPQGLRVWSPALGEQKFKHVLNLDGLTDLQKDAVHLLFDEKVLGMKMAEGFRGHPALGAATLALIPLYQDDPLWKQMAKDVKHDVAIGDCRIMIVGSVFGGTGASALHPLAKYLRSLPEQNQEKLQVGAVALVPYFRFSAAEAAVKSGDATIEQENAAKSEWFPLASRSAAQYYDHLRKNPDVDPATLVPKEWDFNAMYWLGDDSPAKVNYAIGKSEQANPAHFVDLLAAFACLDFFEGPPAMRDCYYAGPEEVAELKGMNVLTWKDLPLTFDPTPDGPRTSGDDRQKKIHHFHLMGAAHLRFFDPLLHDPRLAKAPYCVPWYKDRFIDGALTDKKKEYAGYLEALTKYLTECYFPWWNQIHSTERDRVRLMNRHAWLDGAGAMQIQLDRLGNLLYPDNPDAKGFGAMDRVFDGTVHAAGSAGGEHPAGIYLSMLAAAAKEVAG